VARSKSQTSLGQILRKLGPGLITGAAQADPSAIGTYAVAGAIVGQRSLWTAVFSLPLVIAIENICARLGLVTHRGLADILRRRYPRPVAYAAVALLSLATTVNVGADLGAVADSLHLLTGLPALSLIPPTAAAILVLLVAGFFWQSDEEVEQKREDARRRGPGAERTSDADMTDATVDVTSGMSASNVIMFFIILSTALTLHAQGRTDVKSGADAAQALRPIAGDLAGLLFAVGMIGAGLLAVPVLSGATAYALGETFGWRVGLNEKWYRAKRFYAVIAVATLVGMALNFTGVNPIDALFLTSLVMGAIAPPLLVLVMLAARDRAVMGPRRIGPGLAAVGWLATVVTFAVLAGLLYQTVAAG
jgi:Mn2+/Fe2+ NRAMP family transporter